MPVALTWIAVVPVLNKLLATAAYWRRSYGGRARIKWWAAEDGAKHEAELLFV